MLKYLIQGIGIKKLTPIRERLIKFTEYHESYYY